jgi:hypothetical protein
VKRTRKRRPVVRGPQLEAFGRASSRRNTSNSSSTRNTPTPADSGNQLTRKIGHKCVVSIRLDGKTLDRIDELLPEFGGWNRRRSNVIGRAIREFLDKHAKKAGGK